MERNLHKLTRVPGTALLWLAFVWMSFPVNFTYAQITLKGEVRDEKTLKPLIFCSVVEAGIGNGTSTDIDGKFALTVSSLPVSLQFSYLGYARKTLEVQASGYIKILLAPTGEELSEFKIQPGENPADKIIRRLIQKKDTLNPKKLSSFTCHTYNKLIFTSIQDTSKGEIRTNMLGTSDSTEIKVRDFFNRQHLFINESVTERKFKSPDLVAEKVIASRTSGLKDPMVSTLTTQLQSLSFYEEYFEILSFKYLNPLSKHGLDNYYFLIADTSFAGEDTVIVISFHPRRGKKFEALEGVLSVNMTHYALESAFAEPYKKDQISLRIQHKYQCVDSIHWFPVQLNTDIVLNSFSIGTLKLIIEARSYLLDININPELKRNQFGAITVDVSDDAVANADQVLQQYRISELNSKDSITYRTIDSIAETRKIERKIEFFQALMDGRLRISVVDIELSKIITYNNYEGVRLGLGAGTNERLLKWFRFGGYFAYGFGDKSFKYSGWGEFRLHRRSDTKIRFDYKQDLVESGSTDYPLEGPLYIDNLYRSFILGTFDSIQLFEGALFSRPAQNVHMRLGVNHQVINPVLPYRFLPDTSLNPVYRFTEFDLTTRWGIKEKYIAFGSRYISTGNKYPVIWFRVVQSIPGLGGQFLYTKLMSKVEQTFHWRKFGKTRLIVSGGYIFGEVPYTKLFNERGGYAGFSFVSRSAFETMRPNEFLSDAFISFYFSQSTGTLFKVKRWMKPELSFVHNLGFGWLRNASRHNGVSFLTMEKGFFETGLVLDKLITLNTIGLGVGVFYRYGAYSKKTFGDNLFVKMALTVGM